MGVKEAGSHDGLSLMNSVYFQVVADDTQETREVTAVPRGSSRSITSPPAVCVQKQPIANKSDGLQTSFF